MDVVFREDFGRCAVAAHDLQPGDLILSERATLFWKHGPQELLDIVRSYLGADRAARERVDSLTAEVKVASKFLDEQIAHWTEVLDAARACEPSLKGCTTEDLLAIIKRAHFNAHAVQSPEGACLFPRGAMVNHSCSPNSFYRCEEHTIHFHANRAIAKGEEITAAYLDAMTMLKPTAYRQELLLQGKGFICSCERCSSLAREATRPVRCSVAGCVGTVYPGNVQLQVDGTVPITEWTCTQCQSVLNVEQASKVEDIERELYQQWEQRDAALTSGRTVSSHELAEAIIEASDRLHPTHFIAQFGRVLAIEVGSFRKQDRLNILACAFTYTEWLDATFGDSIPSNLLGTMTGAMAELFDKRSLTIEAGLPIDKVLATMRHVLPYATIRYGRDAAYPRALQAVLDKYTTCSNLICTSKGKLARCGRCDSSNYCSRNCQIFHFKSQGHKATCLEIVEKRKQLAALITI